MRRLAACLVALVGVIGLGALLGVIWEALAPRVTLVVASDGRPYPEGYQPEGYMTDDGIAALLCVAAGLVVGVAVVWVAHRIATRDHALLVALGTLLVSGLLGLLLARLLQAAGLGFSDRALGTVFAVGAVALWWTGETVGGFDFDALVSASPEGTSVTAPLQLRMSGALVLWPLSSVVVVFVVALADWWRGREHDRA